MKPSVSRGVLGWLLRGSGAIAVSTSAWVIARGASAIPAGDSVSPSTDSVLRFYAAWWGGSGVLMASIAAKPEQHPALVRGVAAATFVGGLARLIAARQSGWPHPLFRMLTALELVTPPVMLCTQRAIRTPSSMHTPVID